MFYMPRDPVNVDWAKMQAVGTTGSPYYSMGPAFKSPNTPPGCEYAWYKGMYHRHLNKVIGAGAWFTIHHNTAAMFLCLGVWVQRSMKTSASWSVIGILREFRLYLALG
jgi:hypothetical protein